MSPTLGQEDFIEIAKWQYLESLLTNPSKILLLVLTSYLKITVHGNLTNDAPEFADVLSAVKAYAQKLIDTIKPGLRSEMHRDRLHSWLKDKNAQSAIQKPMAALKESFKHPLEGAVNSSAPALAWLLETQNASLPTLRKKLIASKLAALQSQAKEEKKPVEMSDPRSVDELAERIGKVTPTPRPERKKKSRGKRRGNTKVPVTSSLKAEIGFNGLVEESKAKPATLFSDRQAESIVFDRQPQSEKETEGLPWTTVGRGRSPNALQERASGRPLGQPVESPELQEFVRALKQAVAETAEEIEELEDQAFATLKLHEDEEAQKKLIRSLMPPIEVHNHLTGILTVEDLVKMHFHGNYDNAAQKLFAVYRSSAKHDDTPKNIAVYDELARRKRESAVTQLHAVLTANASIQYETAYAPRGKLMSFISSDRGSAVLWEGILNRLKMNGIRYVEIRVSDENFPKALRGISRSDFEGLCKRAGIKVGFLPSASSKQNFTTGHPVTERTGLSTALSLDGEFSALVTGVDVGGPEDEVFTFGEREFIALFKMVGDSARQQDRRMVVSPHVGEGHVTSTTVSSSRAKRFSHTEVALKNIQIILGALRKLGYKGDNDVIVRLGHVTHIDYAAAEQMGSTGIFAEVNISSNLMTGSLTSLEEHPLLLLLFHEVPTLLSTDGQGVVNTSLLREFRLADAMIELFKRGRVNMKWVNGWITYERLCQEYSKDEVDRRLNLKALVSSAERYLRLMNIEL